MAAAAGRRNGNKRGGDDSGKAGQGDHTASTEVERCGAATDQEPVRAPSPMAAAEVVAPRAGRYLVAAAPPSAVGHDAEGLAEALAQMPGVKVVATVAGVVPAGTWPAAVCPPVVVVQTNPDQAALIAGSGRFHVEVDIPLGAAGTSPLPAFAAADTSLPPTGDLREITLLVRDDQGRPVGQAAVYVLGGWTAFDVTDTDGRAVIKIPAAMLQTSTALVVQPARDHWSKVITCPQLSAYCDNTITVEALSSIYEGFPLQPAAGWGAQALRINRLPPTHRGHGVNIALIDTGIAAAHPEFEGRIRHGVNLCDDPAEWSTDTVGTATACAGIIAAADNDSGITGLAVDADIHAVKVLPDGGLSHLLQAIDYCIAHHIDVAQINATVPGHSPLLAAKLADAHNAGIVVIAPAGDTGTTVSLPAALPGVVAVGAVGRTGTFPADSVHATHLQPAAGSVEPDLPAVFTARGHGVDVSAPGVAILTTAAPSGYTVRDGTALAAAHITALAALMLAHHEDFRHAYAQRGPARGHRLHQLLLAAAQPLNQANGAAAILPDACQALGLPAVDEPDWDTAVLQQLELDLSRAGHL